MKKILIVEDDTSLYKMYVTELELRKYNVVWVNSGDKACESAKKESPDLILLDIMLPQVDGLSILKGLKDSENTKKIHFEALKKKKKNAGATGRKKRGKIYSNEKESEREEKDLITQKEELWGNWLSKNEKK